MPSSVVEIPDTVLPQCREMYVKISEGVEFMRARQPDVANETAVFEKVKADLEAGLDPR